MGKHGKKLTRDEKKTKQKQARKSGPSQASRNKGGAAEGSDGKRQQAYNKDEDRMAAKRELAEHGIVDNRFAKSFSRKGQRDGGKAPKQREEVIPFIHLDRHVCNKLDYAVKQYQKSWSFIEEFSKPTTGKKSEGGPDDDLSDSSDFPLESDVEGKVWEEGADIDEEAYAAVADALSDLESDAYSGDSVELYDEDEDGMTSGATDSDDDGDDYDGEDNASSTSEVPENLLYALESSASSIAQSRRESVKIGSKSGIIRTVSDLDVFAMLPPQKTREELQATSQVPIENTMKALQNLSLESKDRLKPKCPQPGEIYLPHIAVSREALNQSKRSASQPIQMSDKSSNVLNMTLMKEFTEQQSLPAYREMLAVRRGLPAWDKKDEILSAIKNSQVVVISGETGCGKSTQVPQFILDSFLYSGHGTECNILVTQPRRISAIGVAERVASERAEKLGNSVGYQIRLESRTSKATRILYCTTGILLRRLEGNMANEGTSGIDDISHIVIDEVHERSLESDFLMMVLRDLLATRKDLKLILMSATLNAELFSNYFGSGIPVIHIPGRTFPVKVMYLEEILSRTGYKPEGVNYVKSKNRKVFQRDRLHDDVSGGDVIGDVEDQSVPKSPGFAKKKKSKGGVPVAPVFSDVKVADDDLSPDLLAKRYPSLPPTAIQALSTMDSEKIQYPLIETLLETIIDELMPPQSRSAIPGANRAMSAAKKKGKSSSNSYFEGFSGSEPRNNRGILIFLPGYAEIATLHELICANAKIREATANGRYCIPLHSSLTSEEQVLVFKNPPEGSVKIVIATNIAETSITIDDVVFVIDSGKMKEIQFDATRGMSSLAEVWVSKANAIQRRGRAGRVTTGTCVHLITSHHYEHLLLPQQLPEIQRTPLEQICLRIKTLPFLVGTIDEVISRVIQPPDLKSVKAAVRVLKDISALTSKEDLTPLGFHLGRLPVDVRIGKFILLGAMFHCLDSVLTIASIMSSKSPFVAPFNKRLDADKKKRDFMLGNSDYITMLVAYNEWQEVCRDGPKAEWAFGNENFLGIRTLRDISSMKRQLAELVSDIGFIRPLRVRDMERAGSRDRSDGVAMCLGEGGMGIQIELIKSLLVAALYPQILKIARHKNFPMFSDPDSLVYLHPSSVNSNDKLIPGDFIVYHVKIQTSKIWVRDSCPVSAITVALFGGDFRWKNNLLTSENGWINIRADKKSATHLIAARGALEELLFQKISKPDMDISSEPIITEIINVINGVYPINIKFKKMK